MLTLLVFLCFLFDRLSSGPVADNYMDSLIGEPLQNAIQDMGLDPAPLPDFSIPFKHDLGPVPLSGQMDYFNGIFNGLSKIRRFSECDGPAFSRIQIKIECILNLFGMSIVYDAKAKIEQLPPIPFQVTARVDETHIKNTIVGEPKSLKGKVKVFKFANFKDIDIRSSGLGLMQDICKEVEVRFREKVREELIKIITGELPSAFQKALTQVQLPSAG